MSKPNYNLCDRCGEKTNTPTIFLETGHYHDGVESRPEGKNVDLCEACLHGALNLAVYDSYERALSVLSWVEKGVKR